jgi:uncharacterized protein YggT (Ycf19 family)
VVLATLVGDLLDLLCILIFIEAIIANLIAYGVRMLTSSPPVRVLRIIVNPILNPIRRLLPPARTGGWDLSPLIAIVLLSVLQRIAYTWA